MLEFLPPGSLLILGSLLFIVLRGRASKVWLIALPIVSAIHLLTFSAGTVVSLQPLRLRTGPDPDRPSQPGLGLHFPYLGSAQRHLRPARQ